MKKFLVLLLTLGLLITALAGCATANTTAATDPTGIPAAQIFKITYDRNYTGAVPGEVKMLEAGQTLTYTLMRWGYTFSGWYLEPACTTSVDADAKASKNMTLYAGWTKWDDKTAGYMKDYKDEMDLAKYLTNRPTAFEPASFNAYYEAYFDLYLDVEFAKNIVNDASYPKIQALKTLRHQLVKLADTSAVSLYIWGDSGKNMAVEKDMQQQEYLGAFDSINFKPFLLYYPVNDQTAAKGNIIIVAGGDYTLRNNYKEAYTTARDFQARGYNAFVLQRRVAPSAEINSSLDLQRSIRYLRYNAGALGLGAPENIIACGFADGGFTILNTADKFYGDVSPTTIYADYVPDEVDQVSADLSAMILIYGVQMAPDQDSLVFNNDMPPAFIVSGTLGTTAVQSGSIALYQALQAKDINTELLMFSGAPDGFGLGKGIAGQYLYGWAGFDQWSALADTFLQVEFKQLNPVYYP